MAQKKIEYLDEMLNIQKLSVDEFVDMMLETYMACIKKGISVSKITAPFLWGATGIGKSDGVKEFAARLQKESKKEVRVLDIRLSTQSPMDLKGLLLPSADRTASEYTPLKTYQFEDREDLIYILFYDELTSASAAIQAAAYEIIRDRKIDQNVFPDNVIILGAGNRTLDKGLTYRMLRPLANRFEHYQILTTFEMWKEWAERNDIHPLVIEYLQNRPNKLSKDNVEANDLAFPTPRTWENVSFYMNLFYEPQNKYTLTLQRKIAGTIGVGEEREFHQWIQIGRNLPPIQAIVSGKCTRYPENMDQTNAMIHALVQYIKDNATGKKMSVIRLENICTYATHFSADFAKIFHDRLCEIEEIKPMLMKVESFYRLINRKS